MTAETRAASVRVPGTSSNLGGGFDCIGVAVDRWLSASVEASGSRGSGELAVTMSRKGTLGALALAPKDDALYAGFVAACTSAGRAIPNRLAFVVDSEIPVARGLGSSSAALVAGARLADRALELGLGAQKVAELCTTIETHPDNVAPAVFGGAMLAVPNDVGEDERWVFTRLPVHHSLAFVFIVPPFAVETAAARAILPRSVPHEVAVKAAGKGAALAHGLSTGDGALLRIALDDVLHVPYRIQLVPGLAGVRDAAMAVGAYGVTLSGSGSTLVAVAAQEKAQQIAEAMQERWRVDGTATEIFVQRRPASVDHEFD